VDVKYLFVLGLVLISLSCRKPDEGQYKMEYIMDFTIPAGANPLKTHVFERTVVQGWDQFLKAHQLHDSMIARVQVYSITVSPFQANPISYGFVEEMRAFIRDASIPATQQIGVGNPLPNERVGEFALLPGIAEVSSFLKAERFDLQMQLRFRGFPSSFTDHRATFQFDVFLK
jgi:hypothetical protein